MLVFRDPSSSFLVSSNVTNAVIAISFTSPGKNFSKPLAPSKLSSERCFKLGGKRCYAAALKRPIYTRRFFLTIVILADVIVWTRHISCSWFAGMCCKTTYALLSVDHIHHDDNRSCCQIIFTYFPLSRVQFLVSLFLRFCSRRLNSQWPPPFFCDSSFLFCTFRSYCKEWMSTGRNLHCESSKSHLIILNIKFLSKIRFSYRFSFVNSISADLISCLSASVSRTKASISLHFSEKSNVYYY